MEYVIVDLERTSLIGVRQYWKGNRYGYVMNINEAGIFSEDEAMEIVLNDFKNYTALIPLSQNKLEHIKLTHFTRNQYERLDQIIIALSKEKDNEEMILDFKKQRNYLEEEYRKLLKG